MIHFEHTAAAVTLWLGAAHQAHPGPFADLHREIATLGPMSRALIGHTLSQRVAVAGLSWSPDNSHSLYLALARYREVLYGAKTPTAALNLCPVTFAGEAATLHNFAKGYVSRHPELGWKFGVARLAAWRAFGFIPASEVVRSVEYRAPHLSKLTCEYMLGAGFFGRRFKDFFNGNIPHSTDGRVSVLHAICHAAAITMGALSFPDDLDAATLADIRQVARELVDLMDNNPVLLAALRAQMGDDGFSNWLAHDAFTVYPYAKRGLGWAWVAQIPELPIHTGA